VGWPKVDHWSLRRGAALIGPKAIARVLKEKLLILRNGRGRVRRTVEVNLLELIVALLELQAKKLALSRSLVGHNEAQLFLRRPLQSRDSQPVIHNLILHVLPVVGPV